MPDFLAAERRTLCEGLEAFAHRVMELYGLDAAASCRDTTAKAHGAMGVRLALEFTGVEAHAARNAVHAVLEHFLEHKGCGGNAPHMFACIIASQAGNTGLEVTGGFGIMLSVFEPQPQRGKTA